MKHIRTTLPAREAEPIDHRIGVELEFAGLDEATVVQVIAGCTGGSVSSGEGRSWACETEKFGTCAVYLDTQFDDVVGRLGGSTAQDLLRKVVPVEIVTEPFSVRYLPALDDVVRALRRAGALGSRDGLLFGFGLHLNIEMQDTSATYLSDRLAAYALLEDYLRKSDPIDVSRRLLPFVAPYPAALVDAVTESRPETMEDLMALYLHHAPTRDHGLDLLPILAEHDRARVTEAAEGLTRIKSRPAFHFRLPDCRIDEAGWSVLEAWDQWSMVEAVASDPELLGELRAARRIWSTQNALTRAPWFRVVADILQAQDDRRFA